MKICLALSPKFEWQFNILATLLLFKTVNIKIVVFQKLLITVLVAYGFQKIRNLNSFILPTNNYMFHTFKNCFCKSCQLEILK